MPILAMQFQLEKEFSKFNLETFSTMWILLVGTVTAEGGI